MNSGHSVPRYRASAISSWICWTPEDLVPVPFVVGGQAKYNVSGFRGDAGAETKGGSPWQRTIVYVLVRLAGAYGTVRMPERRGYAIAPRFRSIAAYRRWSPIPHRRIPFSQVAIRACS